MNGTEISPWIETYTGRKLDLADPNPESICMTRSVM